MSWFSIAATVLMLAGNASCSYSKSGPVDQTLSPPPSIDKRLAPGTGAPSKPGDGSIAPNGTNPAGSPPAEIGAGAGSATTPHAERPPADSGSSGPTGDTPAALPPPVEVPSTPEATPPSLEGTITVAARTSNGDVILWRGPSDDRSWSAVATQTIYRMPMQLADSPTLLYQPESKGAPAGTGGRLHIFGRSTNNQLAYRWCDINRFGKPGEADHNCQGSDSLPFSPTGALSVVLLKDGTLLGFYRGGDGQIASFRGPGGPGGLRSEGRVKDHLADTSEAGA